MIRRPGVRGFCSVMPLGQALMHKLGRDDELSAIRDKAKGTMYIAFGCFISLLSEINTTCHSSQSRGFPLWGSINHMRLSSRLSICLCIAAPEYRAPRTEYTESYLGIDARKVFSFFYLDWGYL